ncbi:hypothetical protein C1637_24770 [Chryseobacterium lactis]|uniref:Uncharacterized protein n=2 Tax=Chryseobacterium lactis TaxID=1241981 RepID=A0A3G6RPQ5_CHRLC|nr:hypothetical protein EG342_08490 [Chryseobacterium lactis]AZB06941.1 hypothetical protein EG341_24605 [Chryseobacterium lactis]PNW10991.1 hypothetical protein C1637_24770 [Chryseobacterium lactis]
MAITTVISYNVADYVNPPVTENDNKYMPVGNVIESIFCGFLALIISFYISLRILRERKKNKYPFNQKLQKQDL